MRSPVWRMASPPPTAASGEALRIEGVPEVPDWRPSPMQGNEKTPLLDERARRLHVHHLGGARIADRAGAAHDQDRVLVDAERRIVDAVMIVLRPIEDDDRALEGVGVLRIRQVAVAGTPSRSRSSS